MADPIGFEPDDVPVGFEPDAEVLPDGFEPDELELEVGADMAQKSPLAHTGNIGLPPIGSARPLNASFEQPEVLEQREFGYGGQTEADYSNSEGTPWAGPEQLAASYEQAVAPMRPAIAQIESFKKENIDPIVKWVQDRERQHYEKHIAPILRPAAPKTAFAYETLARPALGKTEVNEPGSQHPAAVESVNWMEEKFGIEGAATAHALMYEGANLPFYLIPGVGQGGVMQGLTGGALGAVFDPEQEIVPAAVGGAVGGKVLEGVFSAGGKLISKVKGKFARKPSFEPIAVVPPEAESELAQKILDMPDEDAWVAAAEARQRVRAEARGGGMRSAAEGAVEPAPPDLSNITGAATPKAKAGVKRKAPVAVAVGIDSAGAPVMKALNVEGGVLKTTPVTEVKQGWEAVLTEEARLEVAANPDGELARKLFPPPAAELSHGRLIDIQDWEAGRVIEERAGKVLVLEGDVADGSARLYDITDPKVQRAALSNRGLVEVTLDDGSKVLGYKSGDILVAPDPAEKLPRAAQQNMEILEGTQYKHIEGPTAIDNVLAERQQLAEELESRMAKQQADAAAAQADQALGGDGSGGKLPPDLPMDPPPPPPPGPHNVDPSEAIKLGWADKALRYVNRKLLNPTVRGAQDVADIAFSTHSVDTFERLRDDVLKTFAKVAPEIRQMQPQAQREVLRNIDKYVTGDMSLDDLRGKHPELNASIVREVDKYKAEISWNQDRLQALGMLASDAERAKLLDIDESELSDYATRMYYRFLMKPGEWAKMAKRDAVKMAAMKQAIITDVYSGKQYAQLEYRAKEKLAQDHLDYLLGDPDALERISSDPDNAWKQVVSEAGGSLKQRKDMAWWKRSALGEVDNPFVRIAESMARQKQLILMGEMYQAAATNPNLSSDAMDVLGAQARGHTRPVPMNPALYGQMAGRLASPETWEALVQAPLAQRNQRALMNRFVNAMKFNQTVGNPGSWVTNFFANSQSAMLSNLVNPLASPLKIGNGMRLFAKDLRAHKAAPGLRGDVSRDRWTRAMELGVVGSDYSTAEFRESASLWERTLEDEATRNGGRVNPLDLFPRLMKMSKDQLARKYGAIDSMWKYATYTSGLQKGGINLTDGTMNVKKAIDFIGARYRPGMDDAAIRKAVELEVAQRIHYAFPMLDRVGEVVAKGSQAAGIVNPYLKVKMELMRNYAQLPGRMIREKGMTANLMGYTALVGGAYYALKTQREKNGINQQEVDAAFASAPGAVQRFKPGAMALWDRASNGKVRMIDMTQMFEPLTWLQGNPESSVPTRFLQNLALSPVDGSLIEPELAGQLAQSGMFDAAYARPHTPEWQQGGAKLLTDTIGRLGPGIFRNTYTTAERGGAFVPKGGRGPDAPVASPGTTVFNMLAGPNRLVESGGADDRTRAIQAKVREVKAAEAEIKALGPKNDGQSMGVLSMPLDKEEAKAKAKAVMYQKKAELDALRRKLGR